jgi:hypothetical protein
MYQSGFGYFLCGLRFFALGWFWYSVSVTNKKYAAKVAFYKKFAASFALWFYGLPVIVIVAQSIPPWQRFMVVNAMEFTFLFAFQLALLAMYVPNKGFNKSFPFHATTNETFLYAGNRPAAMRSADATRRVVVGAAAGAETTKAPRPGELSDWDKKELARAVHSAKVLTFETKKILDCLTQIEHNNELESDDEAYEDPRQSGGGARTPLRTIGSSGATRGVSMNGTGEQDSMRSPSGREYGTGAYPPPDPRGFGGEDPPPFESNGGYGGPPSGYGDGPSGGGGYGSPRNNPIFASAGNAGPQAATTGAFQPTPPISPANRAGLPPLSEGAARFGDVAGQRSLLARLGKNRGTRPLGSGGYT